MWWTAPASAGDRFDLKTDISWHPSCLVNHRFFNVLSNRTYGTFKVWVKVEVIVKASDTITVASAPTRQIRSPYAYYVKWMVICQQGTISREV